MTGGQRTESRMTDKGDGPYETGSGSTPKRELSKSRVGFTVEESLWREWGKE